MLHGHTHSHVHTNTGLTSIINNLQLNVYSFVTRAPSVCQSPLVKFVFSWSPMLNKEPRKCYRPCCVKPRPHTPYCLSHIHDCFSTEKKYNSVPLPWEINTPERKGSNRKPSTRVQAHTTDKQKGHSFRTWPVQRHMTEVGLMPPSVSCQQAHTLPNTEPLLGEARSCRGGQSPTPKAPPWSSSESAPFSGARGSTAEKEINKKIKKHCKLEGTFPPGEK